MVQRNTSICSRCSVQCKPIRFENEHIHQYVVCRRSSYTVLARLRYRLELASYIGRKAVQEATTSLGSKQKRRLICEAKVRGHACRTCGRIIASPNIPREQLDVWRCTSPSPPPRRSGSGLCIVRGVS